jgi:methionyl-tRNA synthetase
LRKFIRMPQGDYKRFTVTAALPYANGPIHIGHLAGVYIPADIYVRYLRLNHRDVLFVCGSDEHGVPITIRARQEGVSPRQVADKYDAMIRRSFADFGISFDVYSRTSGETHHKTASDFFRVLHGKGIFREIESEQYFDEETSQFLADRYIKGTCPNCGYEEAFGDQCERCGTTLSPSELIGPKSMLSGSSPVLKPTRHWYLPLDEFEPWLREWLLEGHQEWKANVYGQCKSWIDQGLQPRAVTRDLDWGVPVPLENTDGKVLYVWFDAPIGYISATIEWAKKNQTEWEPYWKSKDTRLIHFIGKDNIVFHCIIFPSMLRHHGEFILPDNVPANEFLNLEGNKISTSRNWAVWLHEYLNELPGKEDVLRYVLCANAPETKDNDFTWKDFQAKNNNELLAILGNFINRAFVLSHKYFGGVLPMRAELHEPDRSLLTHIANAPSAVSSALEQFKFREAQALMMDLARAGNKYLADTEPWKLVKTDRERLGTILNLSIQVSANLAVLSEPFLPRTAARLREMLRMTRAYWDDAGSDCLLNPGHQLGEPVLLFEKVEDMVIENQVNKLLKTKATNMGVVPDAPELKPIIEYADFEKLDLRVCTIVSAEPVKGSEKLLRVTVDLGMEQRTVMAGIARHYKPGDLAGRQVMMLANLAPRKIMGHESQGMLLLAANPDDSLSFMMPDRKVESGSAIS